MPYAVHSDNEYGFEEYLYGYWDDNKKESFILSSWKDIGVR
jgi:hypothetical protein